MIRGSDIFRNIGASLTFRVFVLLTLTMAPIGAIAVYQTSRLSETLDQKARDALVASTVSTTTPQLVSLERALGAAAAASLVSSTSFTETAGCAASFDRVIATPGYRFAGVLTSDGLTCLDPTAAAGIRSMLDSREAMPIQPFVMQGLDQTEREQVVFGQPVYADSEFAHFVLLAIDGTFRIAEAPDALRTPITTTILSPTGDLLAMEQGASPKVEIPDMRSLLDAVEQQGAVVTMENRAGVSRTYSVVSLYGDLIYGVSIWEADAAHGGVLRSRLAPWVFPIVMWLATLAISYVAINRLVVRHVRHLGRRMRRFARNRTMPSTSLEGRQPFEFSEMESDFRLMAKAILEDEAELENALHEKTLLLREVHHRVKNNLQLIASIMNMQIRKCRDEETSEIVRRLQDRVLGLAAIHREMYEAQALDRVPAEKLVEAVLDQTIGLQKPESTELHKNLDPVTLLPDQAVPLALLTAELTTNAMTYATPTHGKDAHIEVQLLNRDDGRVELSVGNSAPPEIEHSSAGQWRAGLGTQLIDAFSRQLCGELSSGARDGMYRTRVIFRPADLPGAAVRASATVGESAANARMAAQ